MANLDVGNGVCIKFWTDIQTCSDVLSKKRDTFQNSFQVHSDIVFTRNLNDWDLKKFSVASAVGISEN